MALVNWQMDGGPDALQSLLDLGHEPAPEDYGPQLEWEAPVWRLFLLLQNQWRMGVTGATGIDLTVYLPLIEKKAWHLETALELLTAIEGAILGRRKQQD